MVLGRQREETMDMLVQQIPLELWHWELKSAFANITQNFQSIDIGESEIQYYGGERFCFECTLF